MTDFYLVLQVGWVCASGIVMWGLVLPLHHRTSCDVSQAEQVAGRKKFWKLTLLLYVLLCVTASNLRVCCVHVLLCVCNMARKTASHALKVIHTVQ